MFKIELESREVNPVPVKQIKIYQPEPNLWIVLATSPAEDLEIVGQADGAVLLSPWGTGSPVWINCDGSREWHQARFWQSIDQHNGSDHKYFLVKWFCRDSQWSDAGETAAMNRASQWIYSQKWATETPITSL
jgi:hypothetical protein